ncbi:MAG: SGNH/GDSL hydrolase family protein [Lacunisphaera sp.]|nr:SGNH/GDSL hydrolase family protein [Lacunisphaera sp.]
MPTIQQHLFRLRLLALFLLFGWLAPAMAAPERWLKEIDQLTQADQANPPAPGGIVFVGSSSIRLWRSLTGDFPGMNVVNRGFGGSELADSVFYFDRLVAPHRPRVVVLYAGENDLAGGHRTPEQVAADFAQFRAKVQAALPAARLLYIACKPSPSRAAAWDKFRAANALIAAACAQDPRCAFVDVFPAMLDAQGAARPELYVGDRLHMNAAGYAIWKQLLTPLLGP